MSRPFTEDSKMKGGQNPNNTDDSRPPSPGGSGITHQSYSDLVYLGIPPASGQINYEAVAEFIRRSGRDHSGKYGCPTGEGIIVGWDAGGKRKLPRVGRNEPCPCGSGQKLKKCCVVPPAQEGDKA